MYQAAVLACSFVDWEMGGTVAAACLKSPLGTASGTPALFMNWFALSVKPHHERTARSTNKGYEVFLPLCRTLRRWADRRKEIYPPRFGGYVFAGLIPQTIRFRS